MSATLDMLNRNYPDNLEKLLAASSQIVRLEGVIANQQVMIKYKDVNLVALLGLADSTIGMLHTVRELIPPNVQGEFDLDLKRAIALRADVKASTGVPK